MRYFLLKFIHFPFGTESTGKYWRRKEGKSSKRERLWGWRWRDLILREMRQAWFELHVGGFAVWSIHTLIPHSVRAGVALLNGEEGGTMTTTGKASEWLTRASPTSLTGTVMSGARWLVVHSEQIQHYLGRGLICKPTHSDYISIHR